MPQNIWRFLVQIASESLSVASVYYVVNNLLGGSFTNMWDWCVFYIVQECETLNLNPAFVQSEQFLV